MKTVYKAPWKFTISIGFLLSCLFFGMGSNFVHAESKGDIEALKRELAESKRQFEELESQVFDLEERVGSRTLVRAFDGMSLDLGGFLTQTFTAAFGEDSSEVSFNQTLFEILLKAQVSESISLFTALGFLREADLDFADPKEPNFRDAAVRIPPIIAWANYRHRDSLQFQAGRFVTPHGIINIEHFPPVLLEIQQPQFLRPFSGATIFPNFLNGAQAHGRLFLRSGKDVLQYNMYGGIFAAGDADDVLGGVRVGYTIGETGVTFGFNYAHGRRKAAMGGGNLGSFTVVGTKSLTTNDYDTVGFDLLFDKGMFLWKNEVFYSLEDGEDERLGAYSQPAVRLTDAWIVFYRFDYFDPGQELTKSIEHVAGINFLPIPTVRLRAAVYLKHFDDTSDDATIFQLSGTISF